MTPSPAVREIVTVGAVLEVHGDVFVQISRMLAAKAALAIRYDALGEDTNAEMGVENRAKLEARLRQLEERGVSGGGFGVPL